MDENSGMKPYLKWSQVTLNICSLTKLIKRDRLIIRHLSLKLKVCYLHITILIICSFFHLFQYRHFKCTLCYVLFFVNFFVSTQIYRHQFAVKLLLVYTQTISKKKTYSELFVVRNPARAVNHTQIQFKISKVKDLSFVFHTYRHMFLWLFNKKKYVEINLY